MIYTLAQVRLLTLWSHLQYWLAPDTDSEIKDETLLLPRSHFPPMVRFMHSGATEIASVPIGHPGERVHKVHLHMHNRVAHYHMQTGWARWASLNLLQCDT